MQCGLAYVLAVQHTSDIHSVL